MLSSYFAATNVGDEGGFAPNILDNQEGKILFSKNSPYIY